MKKKILWILVTLILSVPNAVGAEENPFRDSSYMYTQLGSIGFMGRPHFSITQQNGVIQYPNGPIGQFRPTFDQLDSILTHFGIKSWVPNIEQHGNWFEVTPEYVLSSQDNWIIPDNLEWIEDELSRDTMWNGGKLISLGRRALDRDSLTFQEWAEGNSDFASVRGVYAVQNFLTQESEEGFEFVLIVEKHPASDGWFLSSYKNFESGYDRTDMNSLGQSLETLTNGYVIAMESAKASALVQGQIELRERYFSQYSRFNDIVQIKFGDEFIMVNTRPESRIANSGETNRCSNRNYGGFENWAVPSIRELVAVFNGANFDDWPSSGNRWRVRDTPDGYYWGDLFDRLRAISSDTFADLFSQDTSEDDKHWSWYLRIQVQWGAGRRGLETLFPTQHYRRDLNRPGNIAFCFNTDQRDNLKFAVEALQRESE